MRTKHDMFLGTIVVEEDPLLCHWCNQQKQSTCKRDFENRIRGVRLVRTVRCCTGCAKLIQDSVDRK